jgi:hypothetical protein
LPTGRSSCKREDGFRRIGETMNASLAIDADRLAVELGHGGGRIVVGAIRVGKVRRVGAVAAERDRPDARTASGFRRAPSISKRTKRFLSSPYPLLPTSCPACCPCRSCACAERDASRACGRCGRS